jgi:hypothetical protein
MCPQTPSLSPEYSHKAGLQAVITRMPLQTRPVTQRRPRGARYNGPDHTWASEQDEAVLRGDVTAGLRPVLNEAKGVPARFVFVRPATAAKGDERRVAALPSPQQLHPVILEAAHRAAQRHRLGCHRRVPRRHHLPRPGEQAGSQDPHQGERADGHRHQVRLWPGGS